MTRTFSARRAIRSRRLFALLASCAIAMASADEYAGKSTGDVVLLPGLSSGTGDEDPAFLFFPGREYRSGSGWWALSCAQECSLAEVSLTATPAPHPTYDGPMVPGQHLAFAPLPEPQSLLFLKPFRGAAASLRLQAGTVVTYHPGAASLLRPASDSPGTMEGEIALPGGERLRLVPVMLLPDPATAPRGHGDDALPLQLELRLGQRRQVLGSLDYMGMDGPEPRRAPGYLRWAGDLDRDGRPDLLVSLGDVTTRLVLYLSSLAQDGEIVGRAGAFTYAPIDSPGC